MLQQPTLIKYHSMIKVQQVQHNPCFSKEAGDYLVANGYTRRDGQHITGTIYFFKGDKGLIVYGDNVDFLVRDEGEPDQRNAHNSRYMALTGISDLDMFKWMLVFHIADIVPMQQFIQAARKEVPGEVPALHNIFKTAFDHFKVTDNHNAVPVNY